MIEVSGNYLAEDYVRAQYLGLRPRLAYKILGALVLALFFWAAWYSIFGDDDPFVMADLTLPAVIVYLLLFFFAYLPWKARRLYGQQKSLQRRIVLRFEESGLSAENNLAQSVTPWPDFTKWKENDHLFLLYVSDRLNIMVPKRMISDPEDIDRIRQTLLTKVGRTSV